MFTTLRTLLALQMSRPNWIARLGDVSTAFLHAPIAKDHDGKQRRKIRTQRAQLATATSWSTWTTCWYLETRLLSTPSSRPSILKRVGYFEPGKPQQFLGRNIEHFGEHCALGLQDSYIDNMIEETGMTNCNTATAPGMAHYKPTIEDEALLNHEQHKRYRRIVGKLQYTRPDIAYATKELARDLAAPTELSQKRVKHLLR